MPAETRLAPAGTSPLPGHRQPPAAQAAGRLAAHPVAAGVAGAVGHCTPDGANGDHAAAGPADAARPSELELARIRHAGRLLAAQEGVRAPEDDADPHRQPPPLRAPSP